MQIPTGDCPLELSANQGLGRGQGSMQNNNAQTNGNCNAYLLVSRRTFRPVGIWRKGKRNKKIIFPIAQ